MPMNTRHISLIALALSPALLTGCVGQRTHDAAVGSNETLAARNEELVQQLETCNRNASQKDARIAQLEAENANLARLNGELGGSAGRLQGRLDELGRRLDGFNLAAVDPTTDRALAELAARYPGLMTYDPTQGKVMFNADLTFASGSADVQPQARESLRQLAGIMQQVGGSYELRIIGHTDSQRISRAETRQRYGTNSMLSAARAISVRDVLQQNGMAPDRLMFGGFGEYRPAVQNTSSGNTPANRRVEIYVAPYTGTGLTAAAAEGGGSAETVNPKTGAPAPAKKPEFPVK
ncbi:MAG: OmpA family protein [Phycisphaerales bacterium]|nr:OmpA family protein [Phycisphaerales bacterium]